MKVAFITVYFLTLAHAVACIEPLVIRTSKDIFALASASRIAGPHHRTIVRRAVPKILAGTLASLIIPV